MDFLSHFSVNLLLHPKHYFSSPHE